MAMYTKYSQPGMRPQISMSEVSIGVLSLDMVDCSCDLSQPPVPSEVEQMSEHPKCQPGITVFNSLGRPKSPNKQNIPSGHDILRVLEISSQKGRADVSPLSGQG